MARKVVDFGRVGLDETPVEVVERRARIEYYMVEVSRDGDAWVAHLRSTRNVASGTGETRAAALEAALATIDRLEGRA